MSKKTEVEDLLAEQLDEMGVEYERELMLAKSMGRRWRADFTLPHIGIVAEVEGGHWLGNKGRHTNPKGFAADCEKYNAFAELGWVVLRFTSPMVRNRSAIESIYRYHVAFSSGQAMDLQTAAFALANGTEAELPNKTKRNLRRKIKREQTMPKVQGSQG